MNFRKGGSSQHVEQNIGHHAKQNTIQPESIPSMVVSAIDYNTEKNTQVVWVTFISLHMHRLHIGHETQLKRNVEC